MKSNVEKLSYHQVVLFWGGIGLLFCMLLSYGYFLNQAVHNVVLRGQMTEKIADLHGQLGELEGKSIALHNSITLELASSLGLVSVSNPLYIPGTALSRALSRTSSE